MKSLWKIKTILTTGISMVILLTVAACGSGGTTSSSGGSASGLGTISGNVSNSVAFESFAKHSSYVLAEILETAISRAHAAGVSDVLVELLSDGSVVDSKTTDSSGDFVFADLLPGSYSIRVMQNGQAVGSEQAVELSADTTTRIELSLTGSLLKVEVQAGGGQISGEVEDNVSEDIANDDADSEDDVSEDTDSSDDDDSDDDDVVDDDTSDDDEEEDEDQSSSDVS